MKTTTESNERLFQEVADKVMQELEKALEATEKWTREHDLAESAYETAQRIAEASRLNEGESKGKCLMAAEYRQYAAKILAWADEYSPIAQSEVLYKWLEWYINNCKATGVDNPCLIEDAYNSFIDLATEKYKMPTDFISRYHEAETKLSELEKTSKEGDEYQKYKYAKETLHTISWEGAYIFSLREYAHKIGKWIAENCPTKYEKVYCAWLDWIYNEHYYSPAGSYGYYGQMIGILQQKYNAFIEWAKRKFTEQE